MSEGLQPFDLLKIILNMLLLQKFLHFNKSINKFNTTVKNTKVACVQNTRKMIKLTAGNVYTFTQLKYMSFLT